MVGLRCSDSQVVWARPNEGWSNRPIAMTVELLVRLVTHGKWVGGRQRLDVTLKFFDSR